MENEFRMITADTVVDEVQKASGEKYRLIQMCATKLGEKYQLLYSFGKDYDMLHLKFDVEPGQDISSISRIYPCAFPYENEIHDLFGITINQMNIDFHGGLYRTAKKTPFK